MSKIPGIATFIGRFIQRHILLIFIVYPKT
jgi:hypothetical protein